MVHSHPQMRSRSRLGLIYTVHTGLCNPRPLSPSPSSLRMRPCLNLRSPARSMNVFTIPRLRKRQCHLLRKPRLLSPNAFYQTSLRLDLTRGLGLGLGTYGRRRVTEGHTMLQGGTSNVCRVPHAKSSTASSLEIKRNAYFTLTAEAINCLISRFHTHTNCTCPRIHCAPGGDNVITPLRDVVSYFCISPQTQRREQLHGEQDQKLPYHMYTTNKLYKYRWDFRARTDRTGTGPDHLRLKPASTTCRVGSVW